MSTDPSHDPQVNRLAGYFEEIYDGLTHRGVPQDRLPSPWAILSHVLEAVDYDALGEWIEDYAALEAVEDAGEDTGEDTDATESDSGTGPNTQDPHGNGSPRRRPAYLRALGSLAPEPAVIETPEPE